jgi:hypothetical protein
MAHRRDQPTLELLVRSLAPQSQFADQEAILARLETLSEMGAIDDYTVHVVGDGVVPGSRVAHTETGQLLLHRLLVLDRWTDRNDLSLAATAAVDSRAATSGNLPAITVTPATLLEYRGTRLRFASPIGQGDRTCSIRQHLDAIDPESSTQLRARKRAMGIEDPTRVGWLLASHRDDEQVEQVERSNV